MNAKQAEIQEQSRFLTSEDAKALEVRDTYRERRNALLKNVDRATIQKAWFTLSHLLLDKGAVVADMGCDDGAMAYCMAAMNPDITVIGVDKSKRQINKAKETYRLDNLAFKAADASMNAFEPVSLDGIINSFVLHEIYSGSRYNERIVSDTLARQFKMLKKGGTMFIRDFARPPPGEFVLLEMPDKPGTGQGLAQMSEADLLVWYAEHARPRQDPGCAGFFLEELPARIPGTRLFRLPHKWAYEFIMRKSDRAVWEAELPMEYTVFTQREFRKELKALGARVQYAAPHWDEEELTRIMGGANQDFKARLYDDNTKPLGPPATSYLLVARKMAERKSLNIEERRPASNAQSTLKITAMRNEQNGKLVDVVSRHDENGNDMAIAEIMPYRITKSGRLKICLHDGMARGIANAVARGGTNIDDKRWSGHMVETIAVPDEAITGSNGEFDIKSTALLARDYLGVKPAQGAVLEAGPDYYPAPDYIDDHINTFYMKAVRLDGPVLPKTVSAQNMKFLARGEIRELDAQHVLDAITVGMIPNARLELQIMSLFQHLGMKAESWTMKHIQIKRGKITGDISNRNVLSHLANKDKRFKTVKGTAGDLRAINSFFVEEGQLSGALSGLSAQNLDFVVTEGQTINTAVILPITVDMKKDLHAGILMDHLPVPQRHTGSSTTVSAPSFNLPPEVTNLQEAKKYIADKFGVLPHMVIKMGEPYFNHIGFTPQKIYPFAVAAPPDSFKDPNTTFMPMTGLMRLWKNVGKAPHMMTLIARAWKYLPGHLKTEMRTKVDTIVAQRMASQTPDWSVPTSYALAPTIEDTGPEPEEKLEPKAQQAPNPLAAKTPVPAKGAKGEPLEDAPKNAPKNAPEDAPEDAKKAEDKDEKPRPEKW